MRARGALPWHPGFANAGLFGILAGAIALSAETPFPGYAALLPVASCALVIAAGDRPSLARTVLVSRPLVFTGTVSYAWYLWHWPLLAIVRCLNLGAHAHAAEVLAVVVAFGLACLSTFLLEQPIRAQRWKAVAGNTRSLAAAGALTIVTAILSAALWQHARERHLRDLLPASNACIVGAGGLGIEDRRACSLAEGSEGVVYLLGDSHAAAWAPAVAAWAKSRGLRAIERTHVACVPPVSGLPPRYYSASCEVFSREVLGEIARSVAAQQRTLVIVSAYWLGHPYLVRDPRDLASKAMGELARLGVPALLVAPTPSFELPIPACVARRGEDACRKPRAVHDAETTPSLRDLEAIAAGNPNASVFDPTPAFCDGAWCYPRRDGVLLFRDKSHLSRQGAEQALSAARIDFDRLLDASRAAR